MTDLNSVSLMGRLTRDIEVSYLSSGTACGKFSLAVNESKKDSSGKWMDVANYFDVTVWGKTAENLKQFLLKGKQVALIGHLKQDRWDKDGQKFSKVYVVADHIQIGSSGNGNGSSGNFTKSNGNSYPESFTEDICF